MEAIRSLREHCFVQKQDHLSTEGTVVIDRSMSTFPCLCPHQLDIPRYLCRRHLPSEEETISADIESTDETAIRGGREAV